MVIKGIKNILRSKGYKIYTRPYELNIVGVRSKYSIPDLFDDEFFCFWHTEKGAIESGYWKGTTDPGTWWLKNPEMPKGTAILSEGQWENCYAIGLHRGISKALVQVRPVTVLRDYNRDEILDYNGHEDTGLFGINIHAPSGDGKKYIEKDSAGCQVAETNTSHLFLMAAADRHRQLYGNSFTYTLIDYRARRKRIFRRIAMATTLVSMASVAWYNRNKIFSDENKN